MGMFSYFVSASWKSMREDFEDYMSLIEERSAKRKIFYAACDDLYNNVTEKSEYDSSCACFTRLDNTVNNHSDSIVSQEYEKVCSNFKPEKLCAVKDCPYYLNNWNYINTLMEYGESQSKVKNFWKNKFKQIQENKR